MQLTDLTVIMTYYHLNVKVASLILFAYIVEYVFVFQSFYCKFESQ